MELHYFINSTMRPLAERFFLPSVPGEFKLIEHESDLWTSGGFDQDNYTALIGQRTNAIQHELENRLDGSLMCWCDVDVAFYRNCAAELERLAEGKDLLFQREYGDPAKRDCNFGIQVIRRTALNLVFYVRVALLQKITDNGHDQYWGNRLLELDDAPSWDVLPTLFSSESNQGLSKDSYLYHANCTEGESLRKKTDQLTKANSFVKSANKESEVLPNS